MSKSKFSVLVGGSVLGRDWASSGRGVAVRRPLDTPPLKVWEVNFQGSYGYFIALGGALISGGGVVWLLYHPEASSIFLASVRAWFWSSPALVCLGC